MDKKTELIVCLGSSCFSRGSRELVSMIREYLDKNQLTGVADFKGNRCFGNCEMGPMIEIDGTRYHNVDTINITDILDQYFKTDEPNH